MAYIKIIVFTLLSFTMIGNVQADNTPLYFDLGIIEYDFDDLDTTLNGTALNFGVDISNYFGVEAFMANSEKYESSTTTITSFNIDYVAAALLRFNLRYDHVTLFLLGGYSRNKATINIGAGNETFTSSVEVYGAGIDIYGTRQTAITVRWYQFGDDPDISESSEMSVGLHFYFDVPRIHKRY